MTETTKINKLSQATLENLGIFAEDNFKNPMEFLLAAIIVVERNGIERSQIQSVVNTLKTFEISSEDKES